jgi:hypothetical protein
MAETTAVRMAGVIASPLPLGDGEPVDLFKNKKIGQVEASIVEN